MNVTSPSHPDISVSTLLRRGAGCLAAALLLLSSGAAMAKCLPIAGLEPRLIPAAWPDRGTVRLSYLGHSSFLFETPKGVTAVTDYNGYVRPPTAPRIVTMNNAHESHYTDFPDPAIAHVLRGWNPAGGSAIHNAVFDDLRIWNVPTNVREYGGIRYNGNSIFVFEAADLCIAHLGHLHHVLTDTHLGELGLIDVVLVPVDGGFTLNQEEMMQVIAQIAAPVVIPMHYFGEATLGRFLKLVGRRYDIDYRDSPVVTLSRLNLPYRKVLVLPGDGIWRGFGDD